MLSNLGLKLKVFFFMAIVLAALSFLDFILFKTFIDRIDLQQGPKNSGRLVEEIVRNTTYSLIKNSFEIAKDLNFTKASRNAPLKVDEISSPEKYAVIDEKGTVVSGDFNVMNNLSGVPAVERAIKSGYASDGTIKFNDDYYILGVVPVWKEIKGAGKKLFAVISLRKLSSAFSPKLFTLPVRIFLGDKFVSETMSEKWSSMEKSYGSDKMQKTLNTLLKEPGSKTINSWTHLHSYALPSDLFEKESVTIISMTSYLPGWEKYKKVVLFATLYSIGAIVILLFFTFIVTHEIGRVFRKLAADVSRLKVGEKLVLKKYSHGADITVSALNTLISKYQRKDEIEGGRHSSIENPPINGNSGADKKRTRKITAEIQANIPDPFGTDDIEETPRKPIKALGSEPKETPEKKKEPLNQAPPPAYDDDDDEKTQLAPNGHQMPLSETTDPLHNEDASPKDPFDELWDDYCRIKEKNGDLATEKEKKVFIGKLRTNRASIMARYKCSDVCFNIEEKDGKPVIKAKPLK